MPIVRVNFVPRTDSAYHSLVSEKARGEGQSPMSESSTERPGSGFEVVVIGAGQAGLAIGSFLKQQGRRFVILDSADLIGAAWRTRWESLTLFTPRRYSGLPGLPFPGNPEGYPSATRSPRRASHLESRPEVA